MKMGDDKDFATTIHLGLFNGSGRANETNAQKDIVARVDFSYEKLHKFGFYTLQGFHRCVHQERNLPMLRPLGPPTA